MINITPAAIEKLESVLGETSEQLLRVAIKGGGCAGFEYEFLLASNEDIEAEDHIFPAGKARIVIDPVSLPYLMGATLDYTSDLMGAKFAFKNPNVKASCGCGHSFSA